jgi:hypothetical protein
MQFKDSPTIRKDTPPALSWSKRRSVSELHGISIQATVLFTDIVLRASNPIQKTNSNFFKQVISIKFLFFMYCSLSNIFSLLYVIWQCCFLSIRGTGQNIFDNKAYFCFVEVRLHPALYPCSFRRCVLTCVWLFQS